MKGPALASFFVLLASVSCAKKVDTQVKDAVRTFDNLSLREDQIEVEDVTEAGNQLVAEIKVTTAVRMVKKEGKWVIEEIRLADRRWEKAEHILAVINQKRSEATRRELEQLRAAIARYQAANTQVPQAQNHDELVNLLTPDYLAEVIRIDAWSNPFSYKALSKASYDLRSAGPDEILGTPDDLVMMVVRSH